MDNEKGLKEVSNAVRDYNSAIARWKREGYKGNVPPDLLAAVANLYNSSEKFFGKKFGETL